MKDYQIIGRLEPTKTTKDPMLKAHFSGRDHTEALLKFKKRFPKATLIEWQVTGFNFNKP